MSTHFSCGVVHSSLPLWLNGHSVDPLSYSFDAEVVTVLPVSPISPSPLHEFPFPL